MTRQMFSYNCDEVRKLTYDNRQNALDKDDASRLDLHLQSCDACSDYVARTKGMLEAADEIDYGKNIKRDDLFASIMTAVNTEEIEPAFVPTVVAETSDAEPTSTYSKPLRYGLFAIAAALLLGFSYMLIPELSEKPTQIQKQAEVPKQKKEILPDEKVEPIPTQSQFADLVLQPSPKHAQNLNIFGDANAEWKITGKRAQHFELKEGTVLIEYVPNDRSSSLKLQTSQFTIQVLGTIFYASKESQIVGVVAGKIRLQTENGEHIVLERGQEYIPGIGLRNTDRDVLLQSEKLVDVKSHNQRLSKVPKVKKENEKTQVATLKKRDLRKEANLAISKGDYKVAAQILERMVNELPGSAPENATLQLDLARIYIKQLKQPRRAFGHLKDFTKQRPLDAATPTAKEEMCRISKRFNLRDREACQE